LFSESLQLGLGNYPRVPRAPARSQQPGSLSSHHPYDFAAGLVNEPRFKNRFAVGGLLLLAN